MCGLSQLPRVPKTALKRTTASTMLVRQWQLLLAIQGSRAGIGVARLVRETGIGRATVYRYLRVFEAAGVPLHAATVNGEARYRLLRASELPSIGLSSLQIAALHLARRELTPIAGAVLVRELDQLLARLRPIEPQESFRFTERAQGEPHILQSVERALEQRRRARIEYRAASRNGAAGLVHIEPLLLNVADGQPYLRAYCIERGAERTYKLARIARVEVTNEPATYRPARPPAEAFAHSVKVWSGETFAVKIKLDSDVAWRAHEYPLVGDQRIETTGDGAVIVHARVSGIVEATRWVLSWGGAAEALEPPELRDAACAELGKALAKYEGPGPAKAASKAKSREQETGRLALGENRRA